MGGIERIKEKDLVKNMIRLMNKYLEFNIVDNKRNQRYDFLNCEIEDSNDYFKYNYEKENNCINIKMGYNNDVFEESIKLEKEEIQEIVTKSSKINLDIGKMIINKIISKQNEYNMKSVYSFYRESYKKQLDDGKSLIDIRRDLVNEFSDFVWKYHLKEEILFISIHFMDNVICKEEEIFKKNTTERIRYLGYTCFYIAIKIERVINMNCKEICKRLSINTNKILNLEKYVLSQLTFRLNPISSLLFLQYFMGILMESYLKEIIGNEYNKISNNSIRPECDTYLNKNNYNHFKENFLKNDLNCLNYDFKRKNSSSLIINTLNKKSEKGINKVLEYYISCYILEICLYDVELLKFSPLSQALSALVIAKECLGANNKIYVKEYLSKYLINETIMEEYFNRNINTIRRVLKYPFIKNISTTKKYLTSEYMNAANYILRFIHPKY